MRDPGVWNLTRHGQSLCWDGCDLSELAGKFGTPLYVINTALLEQAHRLVAGAFRAEGLDARIFFSYKTNPVPDVLRSLTALGCGAEVISEFELWLAGKLGVGGPGIVVNGSVKSEGLLRRAVEGGAAVINVESADEIRRLQRITDAFDGTVNVGLRINPCLAKSRFDFTLTAGSRRSHIGFTAPGREWESALELLHADRRLRLAGLHFHIGSGVRSARPYMEALDATLVLWAETLGRGFEPAILDIGGGFGTPTLREYNLLEAIRFVGWGKQPPAAARIGRSTLLDEVAHGCAVKLQRFAREHDVRVPTIFVEPGRALVSASQLLLLRVTDIRNRRRGSDVAVCDAGALSISPLMLSERHAVLVAGKGDTGAAARYDIVGNMPAPLDWIALGQELPFLAAGDVIAVMDTGAYFTSLGNNFAGPRPAIVMIERGKPRLVRRREDFNDLVSRDLSMTRDQHEPEEQA